MINIRNMVHDPSSVDMSFIKISYLNGPTIKVYIIHQNIKTIIYTKQISATIV